MKIKKCKSRKNKNEEVYTVELENGNIYKYEVDFIYQAGGSIRPLFSIDGIDNVRLMSESKIENYEWVNKYKWHKNDEKLMFIRDLNKEELITYERVRSIFY